MNESKMKPHSLQGHITHNELKQDGYTIHYFTSGEKSKELLIFLHAAFTDHRCFDHQIDFFAGNYRIVTIDMLGHGLSKVAKTKDKIDATVKHINAIMTIEGYEKAHFVGVSMGTLLAQYFALNHPEKISSITILGGYNINADNREIAKAQRGEQFKWMLKALVSMNSFRKYVAKVSVSKPEEQARFYEMACHFTLKSFMVMQGLGKVIQPRENITITYPLLILSGDNDIELALRMSREWHNSEPQSRFSLIENAGHCANMDQPQQFNRIVLDFIRS